MVLLSRASPCQKKMAILGSLAGLQIFTNYLYISSLSPLTAVADVLEYVPASVRSLACITNGRNVDNTICSTTEYPHYLLSSLSVQPLKGVA